MVNVTEKYTDFSKTNAVCSILSRFNTCISLIVSVESAINIQSKFGDRTFRNFIIKKRTQIHLSFLVVMLQIYVPLIC